VDEVKIPPHEEVAAVHLVHSAAQDAGPGVEPPPRRQAALAQVLRVHRRRAEGDAVVAVALIEPPLLVQHPPLRLQPLVQRRAGAKARSAGSISALISSIGRTGWVGPKMVWTAQNSHWKWQPRPASTRPMGR